MEWALNPVKPWLITDVMLVPLLHQCVLQAGHHYRSQDL